MFSFGVFFRFCPSFGQQFNPWRMASPYAFCLAGMCGCVRFGTGSRLRPMWDKVFGVGQPTLTAWNVGLQHGDGKVKQQLNVCFCCPWYRFVCAIASPVTSSLVGAVTTSAACASFVI